MGDSASSTQAVCVLMKLALARGSVSHLLSIIHIFLSKPPQCSYPISSLLRDYVSLQSSLVNQIKTSNNFTSFQQDLTDTGIRQRIQYP